MIDDGDRIELAPNVPRAARPLHLTRRLTLIISLFLVTMIGAFVVLGYSVWAVSRDRNGWRAMSQVAQQQVIDQGNEITCRSRANFQTVNALAGVIDVIAGMVEASGDQAAIAAIRPSLAPARDALHAATLAQEAAIPTTPNAPSTCNTTPTTTGGKP